MGTEVSVPKDLYLEMRVLLSNDEAPRHALTPIPWIEAASRVVLPSWRFLRRCYAGSLEGITLRDLRAAASRYTTEDKQVLAAALGCVLSREGWWLEHAPGYARMHCRDFAIDPGLVIEELASPSYTQERWLQTLAEFELDPATLISETRY